MNLFDWLDIAPIFVLTFLIFFVIHDYFLKKQVKQKTLALEQEISERKKIESKLRESEERYKELVDLSPDAIVVHAEGKITYANDAGLRLFKAPDLETVIGKPILDFVHPHYRKLVQDRAERAYGGSRGSTISEKMIRYDGSVMDVEVAVASIAYEGKKAAQVVIRDVTERKKAEEQLKQYTERLKILRELDQAILAADSLEAISNAALKRTKKLIPCLGAAVIFFQNDYKEMKLFALAANHGGEFVESQNFFTEGLQQRIEELKSGKVRMIEDIGVFKEFPKPLKKLLDAGVRSYINVPLIAKDELLGTLFVARAHPGSFQPDSIEIAKDIANLLAVAVRQTNLRDIVQKHADNLEIRIKERTKELRQSEEKMRAQFKGIPVPTYIWQNKEDDFLLIDYNDAAERITNGRIAEYLGMRASEMFKKIPEILLDLDKCRRTRESIEKEVHYYFEFLGAWKHLSVKYAYVPPDLIILHTEDITKRKKVEKEVIERTRELETANVELEAFNYSVSHDLHAPLRAMEGYSRILLDDYGDILPADGVRKLNIIRDSTTKMAELINALMNFAQLERRHLKRKRVDVHETVKSVLNSFEAEREKRGVKVVLGRLPESSADPVLLRQVYQNLLANAFKFTRERENPVIEVGSRKTDTQDVFFIKDNGIGFDMKYADKVFKVFQRLHGPDEYEGTGVGMSIVQRIITRHGGRIWAESESNKGTRFYFTLEGESKNEG